ncbi:hypothetical protein [Methanobrevibacter millerae]|uniref:Uncharacterized protein n=1 Tax=Methanobrevibacter millerae TaxID=230361 RepID=A0A1G5WGK2_9EURY|nr:hypothetical protein [Methanobrevibacter millerae]SDA57190.1 hypothetical protein SAMN02910315_01394 [Methanobrevibacter millerae]
MLCPKCGRKVIPELSKCNFCNFDFLIAFDKYNGWELRTHKKIKKYRINNDFKIYNERIKITDELFNITDKDSFKSYLIENNISNEEWNIIQFKLISDIYLNNIKKKQLKHEINKSINSYDGEYKYKLKILTKNFVNLIRLAGVNPFSRYFVRNLNKYNLSIVEGLEVLGCVMKDLLYGTIKYEDLDAKINYFMNLTTSNSQRIEYEEKLNNALEEYFRLTGRNYFSEDFEEKLIKYNLSIKDAYNIKEELLKEIYLKDLFGSIELRLNILIEEEYYNKKDRKAKKSKTDSNNFSVIMDEFSTNMELIGDYYTYYDIDETSFESKNKNKNKHKRKHKHKNKQKKRRKKNSNTYNPINEELGSDDYVFDDMLDIEKECLGDFEDIFYE